MNIRKEIRALTATEQLEFINTLLAMKRSGVYDKYVHWHHAVMKATVYPNEPQDPNYRNGAHRGPAFLPWHREMLMQFEADLQAINVGVTLPYWDWTQDAAAPEQSPVWRQGFLGVMATQPISFACKMGSLPTNTGTGPCRPMTRRACPGQASNASSGK